jgi:hypothetical protein
MGKNQGQVGLQTALHSQEASHSQDPKQSHSKNAKSENFEQGFFFKN